jgi:hypothetical protein
VSVRVFWSVCRPAGGGGDGGEDSTSTCETWSSQRPLPLATRTSGALAAAPSDDDETAASEGGDDDGGEGGGGGGGGGGWSSPAFVCAGAVAGTPTHVPVSLFPGGSASGDGEGDTTGEKQDAGRFAEVYLPVVRWVTALEPASAGAVGAAAAAAAAAGTEGAARGKTVRRRMHGAAVTADGGETFAVRQWCGYGAPLPPPLARSHSPARRPPPS